MLCIDTSFNTIYYILATSSNSGQPASKRSKASKDKVWQWADDGGIWQDFSEDHNKEIENAFSKSKSEVQLNISPVAKPVIIFSRMVQRNKTTGRERDVRCVKTSGDTKGNCL